MLRILKLLSKDRGSFIILHSSKFEASPVGPPSGTATSRDTSLCTAEHVSAVIANGAALASRTCAVVCTRDGTAKSTVSCRRDAKSSVAPCIVDAMADLSLDSIKLNAARLGARLSENLAGVSIQELRP